MKRFFLALFCLCVAACTAPKPPASLRIAFNIFPSTVDPRKSGDFVSSTLICLIYEGLTRCLPDGNVEPAIAERIEVSEDETVYLFHLRPAFWTDGSPVTAYDFEASWKKIVDPEFPALCAYLFYPIKNCEAAAKGKVGLDEVGIEALDERTLRVELERPNPYFVSLTAFPSFLPVPRGAEDSWPTNGPFRIERTLANSEIFLVKSESFWNPEGVHLDEIQIQIVYDENTALQMFERGELDWLGGPFSPLPTDAIESLKSREELRFYPMAATTFCSFNTEAPLLSHPKIRRALSLSIDRDEIVEEIMQMGQMSATRCIPPTLMGGENKTLYPAFDPEEAQKLLEEVKEELRLEEIPPFTLLYRTGQVDKQIAQTLQKQWKETLGVTVELLQTDFKTHKEKLHTRSYEISLTYWIAQFNDPINILERFKDKSNPKNYPNWEDARFAALLDRAGAEREPEARLEVIERAEALFAEEMPLAPIYHWSNPSLCHSRLKNIHTTPSGGVLFERAFIGADP
ncbi:MAG: peptide ABC transporter substrate-binding protein [Verrucomicrobia bacterium]|nr:peptide ABC transporter substrate-binding protein [Verrucomicrobiota bacterium]